MSGRVLVCAAAALAAAASRADLIVIPSTAPTRAGATFSDSLLGASAHSYQAVIGPGELGTLPAGSTMTGIAWRRPTCRANPPYGAWPIGPAAAGLDDVEVWLSTSVREPGTLSPQYQDNLGPDLTLCRWGPLVLQPGALPGGQVAPAVDDFGPIVPFTTPYIYRGGSLLLTIHHTGNSLGQPGELDSIDGPAVQAISAPGFDTADGWTPEGFITVQLMFTPACPLDYDGDGQLRPADIAVYVGVWYNSLVTGGVAGDLDRDGRITPADVALFVSQWFDALGGC